MAFSLCFFIPSVTNDSCVIEASINFARATLCFVMVFRGKKTMYGAENTSFCHLMSNTKSTLGDKAFFVKT